MLSLLRLGIKGEFCSHQTLDQWLGAAARLFKAVSWAVALTALGAIQWTSVASAKVKELPRRLTLGTQLLLGLTLIAIIVALVAGALIRNAERDYLNTYITEEKKKTIDLLLSSLLDNIISEDVPRLETTMFELIKRDPGLVLTTITNESGKTLFTWKQDTVARPGAEWSFLQSERRLLTFVREVTFSGYAFGTLVVGWDVGGADQEINQHVYRTIWSVGGVCILLIILIYFFTKAFAVIPIKRIAQRVTDFREEIYGERARLPVFASEELWLLDDSVHELSEFLALKNQREEELREAKEAAEMANRTKTVFLANMSHELRTPLNAIIGFSEIIKDETFGPVGTTKYRDYADHINESGQHLLALINDILDLSKIESGTDELHEENIEISETANAIMKLVMGLARTGNVELELDVSDDIPMLHADERKVKQILLNLLSNAIKFTADGGKVTLKIWSRAKSGYVFQVIDTGIGIAFEDITRALAPFRQIDSGLNRKYDGAGLGLPLTKSLVELHGGSLDLQSQVGVGTTVTARFPVQRIIRRSDSTQTPGVDDRMAS